MTTVEKNAVDVPQWHVAGDWFDVCNCNIFHAPLRSRQARAIAKECSPGTAARGTMVMCRSMV
jgi:hypothetical protein